MDAQLVDAYVSCTMAARVRESEAECNELESRFVELEAAHQRKSDEIDRLRRTVKNEQHLKQSALSKLAQIEMAGSGSSLISTAEQLLSTTTMTTAAAMGGIESGAASESGHSGTSVSGGSVGSFEQDLHRRLLELELELVSRERESLTRHKVIIDHFEEILREKREKIEAKETEIDRLKSDLDEKQATLEKLRSDSPYKHAPATCSNASIADSSK